ncbi:ABC transporter permease subunit [Rathayibacter sp. VKM Ac-2803]|uniref:ABC transporter permease n=1 Tax=Rathayibacter sp. VKM Ac-2803 TaxID=2609256 RepID=UPI00135CB2EC|nr:ABC transporter permease [Rathayibacter sp. VKM Ac-2803]MWV48548.1 ABC transporter permease subunit [Rathayibacter sp. VKM Ac-2803]
MIDTAAPPRSATPTAEIRRRRRRLPAPLRLDGSITRSQSLLASIGGFVLLLAIWAGASASGLLNEALVPGPVAVAARTIEQVASGEIWGDIGISFARILAAFALAAVMAVPLGIVMARVRVVEAMLLPLSEFIRYMPVVAFLPLSIVWFGVEESQKLFIIWMGTFFSLLLMVVDDTRRVPRELVEIGRTFGMSDTRVFLRIVWRSALPGIWDSLRLAMGWCWTWLLVAEIIAAESGLGYRITLARRFLDTELIIGYIIVLGLLGLILDQLFRLTGRRLFAYLGKGRS